MTVPVTLTWKWYPEPSPDQLALEERCDAESSYDDSRTQWVRVNTAEFQRVAKGSIRVSNVYIFVSRTV